MTGTTSTTVTAAGSQEGHGFGTSAVFLASLTTILGAIMFLRFGYAVAHTGLMGSLAIIILAHLVTIPTALAVAEIATNQRVEGGGAFFIISRSFGTTIGGAIGIPLYLAQAISVAFYLIAFAEAFTPLGGAFEAFSGIPFDTRMISVPATILLCALVYFRGANLGVLALWLVAAVLLISLVFFFAGAPVDGFVADGIGWFGTVESPDRFSLVFAIIFPAFTGMIAGVGLSGDLANPRRAIPVGILLATAAGFVIYIAEAFKLAYSAAPADLAQDQLIMSRIALWGPIIPIGLACATLSSAIGSILVAPRTLQAMARDDIVPMENVNAHLRQGVGASREPRNALLVTSLLALVCVSAGSVDFVARIISMFFMVTYGSLCAISGLEHFAARPSYRPSFRSRWYISMLGAATCLVMMIQMDPLYAIGSIVIMAVIYRVIQRSREGRVDDLAEIFRGAFTQATRHMQIKLQRSATRHASADWRPSVIMVNGRTFERSAPIQMLTWICYRYGFGTYLHFIKGHLNEKTYEESRQLLDRLIEATGQARSGIFVDTMVSPSMRSALAQSFQAPGVSGMENNTILFEFSTHDGEDVLDEVVDGCNMAVATRNNCLVLRHGDHFFGNKSDIHIWLTWHDYQNANLMILLSYILLGHPDWEDARIAIYAAFPHGQAEQETRRLQELISAGRLPITERRVQIIATDDQVNFSQLVQSRSSAADLVILGFTPARLREKGPELLRRHPDLREILFVSAQERILID